jgi:hypothetical protein
MVTTESVPSAGASKMLLEVFLQFFAKVVGQVAALDLSQETIEHRFLHIYLHLLGM